MKKLQIVFLLTLSLSSFAQKTYYRVNGGKPSNENTYLKAKENTAKNGIVEEVLLRTVQKKDSTIHFVRLMAIPNDFDPYGETKKYIGTRFQIEKFVNGKQKNFNKNFLDGKPTFINFWFTKCPPCIEEIPLLNKLKEKYDGKANFITISFNDKKTIDEFIKQQPFNFTHIPNAKKQIDELNISGYPTSLILDKNGIIKFVFGEINYDIKDIEVIFEGLLENYPL